jgi:predicted component of viral defense system (DUF524 family)
MLMVKQYNVDTSDEITKLLNDLTSFNNTKASNETVQEERYMESVNLMVDILGKTIEEEYAGTLWLFPTAVSALTLLN